MNKLVVPFDEFFIHGEKGPRKILKNFIGHSKGGVQNEMQPMSASGHQGYRIT